jgi:hypothetical protein
MCRAPIKWSTIIVLENIDSTEDLYKKVNEHYESLIEAVEPADSVTIHNLGAQLRKLGLQPGSSRPPFRRANLTMMEETRDTEESVLMDDGDGNASVADEEVLEGTVTLKRVYQTLKKRQRPPPKGGYPFSKNDHVTTKMGRAPPSPCKVCGSANHWDRECPDWAVYLEKQKRGVLIAVSDPVDAEANLLYHSAYCVLLDARVTEPSL